jgi:hypothetical protein
LSEHEPLPPEAIAWAIEQAHAKGEPVDEWVRSVRFLLSRDLLTIDADGDIHAKFNGEIVKPEDVPIVRDTVRQYQHEYQRGAVRARMAGRRERR